MYSYSTDPDLELMKSTMTAQTESPRRKMLILIAAAESLQADFLFLVFLPPANSGSII